jgi:hypothetical protein
LLESGTLGRYAEKAFEKAYQQAVEQAATETGMDAKVFLGSCGWRLDEVLP